MQNNETDNYFIDKFIINGKQRPIHKKSLSEDELNYLYNRYEDICTLSEVIYRIYNKIEKRPKCVCGNDLIYINSTRGYSKFCSVSCASKNTFSNLSKETIVLRNKHMVETRMKMPQYQNFEKHKQTCLDKYGNKNYNNSEKRKQTCKSKYNSEYYLNSQDCKEKTIKKFGVDNYRKTEISKQNVSSYIKEHNAEIKEKRKQTFLTKYGVKNPMQINEVKNKFNHAEIQYKGYITKKKNNSFNISKSEEESYILLKEKYPDIIRQYKSELYPFNCDFYIPSLDLYIECNYSWTHGGKPFENTEEDNIKLNKWKLSNKQYYKNAIETWTIRDIKKREIAKENNLHFIEIWSIKELKTWLNI